MSSHSDTVSIHLICMACKDEGEEKMRKGKKGGERGGWRERGGGNGRRYGMKVEKSPADFGMRRSGWQWVFLEVSIVQRTFEMAHLAALYSTPSRCHHLHTSNQMKMDGENQCHWDERFIKVILPSKLLKPLYLISVAGILTYQHNLFTAETGAMWIYQQEEQRRAGQLHLKPQIIIILTLNWFSQKRATVIY